ncbi:MAG: hypothetical protein A2Z64_15215 [Betaproteobacteria bacterium RIFCSPLOWO2_02_67_12]|nr:MAG: hypothetical protein A2Z64_15215 [Betaproteobacteria bacterium RIFCSPLOWO2_02_67_12]
MERTEADSVEEAVQHETWRAKAHHLLTRDESASGGASLRAGLVLLILSSVLAAILKSVPAIGHLHAGVLELVLLLTTTDSPSGPSVESGR